MAAQWGMTHPEAAGIADRTYVAGDVFRDPERVKTLTPLPKSCVESSRILEEKRALYERDQVFPASVIDYVIGLLRAENDEHMNRVLSDLPADDRLHETRKIMHKDLHRH